MMDLTGLLGAIALPASKFFEPRQEWLDWAVERWRGLKVYDVGAGMGHVAVALRERGLDVEPIDALPRDERVCDMTTADGTTFLYERGSVVLLARPCHGYFAEPVVDCAIACGVAEICYVGFERNLDGDLGEFAEGFERQMADGAGLEDEAVFTLTP